MSTEKPVVFDDDNPEWAEEDFANAKPLDAFPELMAALKRGRGRGRGRGRPVGTTTSRKQLVSVRLDREAVERLKAAGPGWQSRINAAVRREAGLA